MPRIKLLITIALVAVAGLAGCGKNKDTTPTVPQSTTTFKFSFTNLPHLDGSVYQAWAVVSSAYGYSLGKFNINSSGEMIDTTGEVVTDNTYSLDISSDYLSDIGITIEPVSDTVSSPSSYLMGGTASGDGTISLTVDQVAGMSASFSALSGKYILASPTDGTGNNETSGIWFIDNTTGFAAKGLNIPQINSGWDYEGWVVTNGDTLSTGTFAFPDSSDDTLRYGGTTASPPEYPGEDFLVNAPAGVTFPLDLRGLSVFITLETLNDPHPDKPSPFKILETTIPSDAADHQTYSMTAVTSTYLPTGSVTLTTVE